MASLNQWKEEKLDYLWINLTGTALGFVEGLPEAQKTSYDRLCIALDQRFGAERQAAMHKAEVLSKKRMEEEILSALGKDMRRLVSCAYPDFPLTVLEEIPIEKFLGAMKKQEMRLAILQSGHQTLEEPIQKGLQMEDWRIAEDKMHGVTKVRMAVKDEQLRIIKNLQEYLKNYREITQRSNVSSAANWDILPGSASNPGEKEDNNRGLLVHFLQVLKI